LYSKLEKDSTFFNDKIENDCWFNLVFPGFNGSLYCSYFPIQNPKELEKHIKDAYKLVREHHVKADFIDEFPILKSNKIFGMIYSIEGPSASPFQFYLTDSAQHFLRGSLYFNSRTNPDSLAPILNFVRIDLSHLINTFEWTVKKEQKK
jgi:gliding motility-associated lipoprotein GldD